VERVIGIAWRIGLMMAASKRLRMFWQNADVPDDHDGRREQQRPHQRRRTSKDLKLHE
jgi:hypothetical protein